MSRLALCDVSGPLTDLIQKLSGEDGKQWRGRLTMMLHKEDSFNDLKVATVPFDPLKFIGSGWATISRERDKRSADLKEVDLSKVEFITCLNAGESSIRGKKKLSRLKKSGRIRYGASVFMGLWQDYQKNKKNSILNRLYKEKGITYVDFFGDILRDSGGFRSVLLLYRGDGGKWRWRCRWLGDDWFSGHLSAVSPQV